MKTASPPIHIMTAFAWHETHHDNGILRYALEHGWRVSRIGPLSLRDGPPPMKPDGFVTQLHVNTQDLWSFAKSCDVPIVELSDQLPEMTAPRVMPDFRRAGEMVAEHFLERRFAHFAYLGNLQHLQYRAGFCERLRRAGREALCLSHLASENAELATEIAAHPQMSYGEQIYIIARQLCRLPRPLAVFAQWPETGHMFVQACLDMGVQVPDEIAFACITGERRSTEVGALLLSAVQMDYEGQAYRAMELLHRMIEGEDVPNEIHLVPPKTFLSQETTQTIAVPHAETMKAYQFIRANLCRPDLSATLIAEHLGVSRRTLFRYFQEHLDKSLGDLIRDLRLERARERLLTSPRAIDEIAVETGFTNGRHLRHAMLTAWGTTPSKVREEAN